MNNEVVNYIIEATLAKISELEIKRNLLGAGWDPNIVEESFAHYRASLHKPTTNKDEDLLIKPAHASVQPLSKLPSTAPTLLAETQQLTQANSTSEKPKRKKVFWFLPVGILLLVGAFAFYNYIYATPKKVWTKFTTEIFPTTVFSNQVELNYLDENETTHSTTTPNVKTIKFHFKGNIYSNLSDKQNPQGDSEFAYTVGSGDTNFSSKFSYKLYDNKLYLYLGDIPDLKNSLNPNEPSEWLMLDLKELKNLPEQDTSLSFQKTKQIYDDMFSDNLKHIWQDAKLIKIQKVVGREDINGRPTMHFTNSLDKTALENTLNSILENFFTKLKQTDNQANANNEELLKLAVQELVRKLEITNLETWVGIKDFRLYKIKLTTNAPSIVSGLIQIMKQSADISRDAKRLADIKQIGSALELYFNDKGKYPNSQEGIPVNLAPNYFPIIPIAPTPSDGNCTDYYNTYWYEPKNQNKSYEMTFCVGKSVGGYEAGILKLTPAGIMPVKDCPASPDKCYKSGMKPTETLPNNLKNGNEAFLKEFIQSINFSAQFNLELVYTDYDITKPISIPEKSYNLIQQITSALNNNQSTIVK